MNRGGYLITNERMETNVPGVLAAGDVRDKFLKQVATAVGDGAIAGYGAEKYISELEVYESQVLNNGEPSVVYVWNAVDPNCRELMTTVEAFQEKHAGDLHVTNVDIYKSDGIARRLGISEVPAVLYI